MQIIDLDYLYITKFFVHTDTSLLHHLSTRDVCHIRYTHDVLQAVL